MLSYVGAVAAAVLAFKWFANATNGTPGLITPWKEGQYFGSAGQRFDPPAWSPILRTLALLAVNPFTLVLAGGGALVWQRRSRSGGAPYSGLFWVRREAPSSS